MKKSMIIIATIVFSIVSNSKAQEADVDPRGKLAFGLKVGVNKSNVYDATGQNFIANSKMGLAGGAFIGIPIGKYLGIQPEALISQKGYKSTGIILDNPYSDTRTTTYLDIPLQLQFKPLEFLTLLGGVQYSYLLHQRDVYTFGANSIAQDQEFKNDNARKNIFGAVLGVDVTIKHFVFSAKACWDLQNNAGNGSSYTPRYKNVWLQATIGFRLYSKHN
ncbi:MAG: porin family protein [Bacteroidia bacterium]